MNGSENAPLATMEVAFCMAELAAYSIGLLSGGYFLFRLKHMQLINQNLRWIMSGFMVSYVMVAVARSFILVAPFYSSAFSGFWQNLLSRGLLDVGLSAFHLLLPAMALDRIFATFRSGNYAEGTYRRLGLRVVIFVLFVAGAYAFGFVLLAYFRTRSLGLEPVFTDSLTRAVSDVIFLALYFTSAIVLFLVTKANAVLQQRFCKVDLNTRYQFRENETTLAVLAPLVFLYGLVAIPTALFATLRLCAVFPSSTNVLLKETSHLLFALYGPFFAVAFVLAHRHFRRRLKTDLLRFSCCATKGRSDEYRPEATVSALSFGIHFKELVAQWSFIARRDVAVGPRREAPVEGGRSNPSSVPSGPRTLELEI